MSKGLEQAKKVDLQVALRSMVNDVAKSATQSGLKPEGLVVEVRFCFEEEGSEGIRPVVFLGETPPHLEIHRLRVTLGTPPTLGVDGESPRPSSTVPPPPPRQPPPTPPDAVNPRKGPRIVVPSKPILKLRKASTPEPATPPQRDEPQAPVAEVELSPGQVLPVVEHPSVETTPRASLGERFVIFDHQRSHPMRRDFEPYDGKEFDETDESTEVSAVPPEPFEE